MPMPLKTFKPEDSRSGPVAVIDVGAYSARMRIVQISDDGGFDILDEAVQPLPLGNDVFRLGNIQPANIRLAEEIFRDFSRLMQEYGVEKYRAVGTSAAREALNRDIFLNRIQLASGIHLDVLEGASEARLIFLAVRDALRGRFTFTKGNAVIYTIGTGSSQVSVVEDGMLASADTIRLGTLRLIEELGQRMTPQKLREAVDPLVAAVLSGITRMASRVHPENVIAVGAPVRALITVGRKQSPKYCATMSRENFHRIFAKVATMSVEELVADYHFNDMDAAGIEPCCHMVDQLFAITGAKRMVVPMVNTRDALTEDLLREISGQPDPFIPQIINAAGTLATRYSCDETHWRTVSRLAVQLFDVLDSIHGLNQRDRVLLEIAGVLHEVGLFISNRQHHKHSFYLLKNSELPGVTSDEQYLISVIARYHRRATPKTSHTEYMTLSPEDRVRVSKMAAILRVADALDRAHQGKIRDIRALIEDERVIINALGPQDLTLERWGLNRKADMFQQVFGRKIVLERRS